MEVRELTLRSYAKVNLSLDVTGTREDGYHTLETVMQQVSLYDEIRLSWEKKEDSPLEIHITNSKPYLPSDQRNLAYKAALAMQAHIDFGGVLKIDIKKRIPVAAGLGGGSGNAAAVLIGLNRLWGTRFDTKTLCRISTPLGADVPFCVLVQNSRYTCALGEGIGDELTPLKGGLDKFFVLAKPAFGVSTKEVFKGIDECFIPERPDKEALMAGLSEKNYEKVYANMINVLEYYTLDKYKEVQALKEKIGKTPKVRKVLMSGSGPTVMGVYDRYSDAKKACLEIRQQGYEAYWLASGKGKDVIRGEKNDKL